ncbi:hypothetical protein EUGRSUZ_B00574 [Eucalyptus grandis]|uniref:Uncharacterized protein n=2 Tax=Eucalyptus grandis TaxID=71139 RepID=A0ACC3LMZ9_EUCGR|nr:hypothetical protein EUGRSUZ_B00574 [Eucalyptus grandis]
MSNSTNTKYSFWLLIKPNFKLEASNAFTKSTKFSIRGPSKYGKHIKQRKRKDASWPRRIKQFTNFSKISIFSPTQTINPLHHSHCPICSTLYKNVS